MNTIITFYDITKKDEDSNSVEITDYNLAGLTILPRIGESVILQENSKHYHVSKIQHVFNKESDYETKHLINIHLKQ